ncbi:MAG: prepilin-type N-terminal cleavage/methylation domain-containing protein [Planctomycetota bacterium]
MHSPTPTDARQPVPNGSSATGSAARGHGFTLIELVIALAILSASILTILYLQIDAVEDAGDSVRDRHLQLLAQQKLDDVMFGIEEGYEGTFERDPGIQWSVVVNSMGTNPSADQIPLVECTITVTKQPDPNKDPVEYRLTCWFFPDAGNPILDLIETPETTEGSF